MFQESIKAYKLGDVAARPMEISSPPKLSIGEMSKKALLLPDGRIVTVALATGEEFHTFVSSAAEQFTHIATRMLKAMEGKEVDRLRSAMTQVQLLLKCLNKHSDIYERWYTLLELLHAIGGKESKYHVDLQLFVEDEQAGAA